MVNFPNAQNTGPLSFVDRETERLWFYDARTATWRSEIYVGPAAGLSR